MSSSRCNFLSSNRTAIVKSLYSTKDFWGTINQKKDMLGSSKYILRKKATYYFITIWKRIWWKKHSYKN